MCHARAHVDAHAEKKKKTTKIQMSPRCLMCARKKKKIKNKKEKLREEIIEQNLRKSEVSFGYGRQTLLILIFFSFFDLVSHESNFWEFWEIVFNMLPLDLIYGQCGKSFDFRHNWDSNWADSECLLGWRRDL